MDNPRSTRLSRRKASAALAAAGGLLATAGVAGLGPVGAEASSHREAPLIAGAPQYDTTDVYAFRSPEAPDTVTLLASVAPFSEPAGGPNFYPFADDARYNIKIDNDGDAKPDITYRWTFKTSYRGGGNSFLYANGAVTSLNDENLLHRQTYKLERIANGRTQVIARNAPAAPSFVGDATMPDYAALRDAAVRESGRTTFFAGQSDDPFFLDLRVFDLLYGGDLSQVGDDTLAGFAVNTFGVQVPREALAAKGNVSRNPIIGVWSTTDRRGANGKFRQVSRLGMPLVNEVVIPVKDKDGWNRSVPAKDGQYLDYVTDPELPTLLELVYGLEAPATPRNDLVQVFLTGVPELNQPRNVVGSEQIRLNMDIPVTPEAEQERLGVLEGDLQGFPNGRRLTDDVIDIALQVVAGELTGEADETGQNLGDGVDANDVAFEDTFPYVALPKSGSDADPHSATGEAGDGGPLAPLPLLGGSALALGLTAMTVGAAGLLRRRRQD